MSTERNLQVVLAAQAKRNDSPDIADTIVEEMKSSNLFHIRWDELLMSAPVALTSIGAIYVASSSQDAMTIELSPPPGKSFKYLNYTSLRANLTQVGDIGRFAFIEAESGMGRIKQLSLTIFNLVPDIVTCLGDPPSAKKNLRGQMMALHRAADRCQSIAAKIDDKFETWLNFVCEFHEACEQQSSTTEGQLRTTEINLLATKINVDQTQAAVDSAKDTKNKLKQALDTASDAYKKASEKFPTGWDLLGQEIVGDLANCLTTAISQAVPALMDALDPMAEVKVSSQAAGNILHGNNDGKGNTGGSNTGAQGTQQPYNADPRPQGSNDPAYVYAVKDKTYLTLLETILTSGKDGGVNWEEASGGNGNDDKAMEQSTQFLCLMLSNALDSFKKVVTGQDPSKKFLAILESAVKIASAINAEVQKGKQMQHEWPAASSPLVQGWQKEYKPKYLEAVQMIALARSLPGNTNGGLPPMTNAPAPDASKADPKSARTQAVLKAAQERLDTTQKAFLGSQDNYLKSSQLLVDEQNKLGEVKANLEKLGQEKLSLEDIKKVLFECIKLVISLKQQITQLVRFFKSISDAIETVVDSTVQDFLDTVAETVSPDGSDFSDTTVMKIGSYTYTDFQRTTIFHSTLTIRAWFGVFGDIAGMWVKLSNDHIMPGVALAEELGMAGDDAQDLGAKSRKLQQWSADAQAAVKQIAAQKQQQVEDGMQASVEQIEEITKELPPAPAEVTQAIDAGAGQATQAAQTALQENSDQKPVNKFHMKTYDDF